MDDLEILIRQHRELDKLVENADKTDFLSDWNCHHPYYKEEFTEPGSMDLIKQYNYIRAADNLTRMISEFHQKSDSTFYGMEEIVTSNGSTTIISSILVWLSVNKVKEVYYIPPVYYTFTYFSKLYGISLRPISGSHLFEKDIRLNLPEKKCTLLLTDPIWYAGISVPVYIYELLGKWQQKTGSTIIVDGSFQYLKWDGSKFETSCKLDKSKTLRLICPSKVIAIHGFRFSYLLVDETKYDTFDYILDNICGSSSYSDISYSQKCMSILLSQNSNSDLINYTENKYQNLRNSNVIADVIEPDSGYFIFARLNKSYTDKFRVMEGEYFQQKNYPGYVRINLLSSCVQKILTEVNLP